MCCVNHSYDNIGYWELEDSNEIGWKSIEQMQKGSAEGIEGMGQMRRLVRYFAVLALLTSSAAIAFVMLYNNVSSSLPVFWSDLWRDDSRPSQKFHWRFNLAKRHEQQSSEASLAGIWPPSSTHWTALPSFFTTVAGIPAHCGKQVHPPPQLDCSRLLTRPASRTLPASFFVSMTL